MIKDFNGTIVCASKYFNTDEVAKIYNLGIRDFGENNVQDLLYKKEELSDLNITWHIIGKLQTNKIKKVINEIEYLHSLESIKQAELIQKHRITPLKCFIQVNIAEEMQKSGINQSNLSDFINEIKKYDKIEIVGLMTIGVLDDLVETERVFEKLVELKNTYKLQYTSMGMTNDFELAIKHKATHLRLGNYFKSVIGG